MANRFRLQLILLGTLTLGLVGLVWSTAAAPRTLAYPAEPMLADDVNTWKKLLTEDEFTGILKVLNDEIEKGMRSNGVFLRSFRKLQTTGHLVALLGNIGTVKLEGDHAKKAATLREAGLSFAEAAKKKNYAEAKKASEAILKFPDGATAAAEAKPAKWLEVIPLETLMKAVSSIDGEFGQTNASRKPGDFKKKAKDLGHKSVLMGVLAVVARDHESKKDWQEWCDSMRDESILLAKEYFKSSQPGSVAARKNLTKTCDACHEVYRKEE